MSDTHELDTTSVKCPNNCRRPAGYGLQVATPRQFRWYDGGVGTRNYCSECGSELVEVNDSDGRGFVAERLREKLGL